METAPDKQQAHALIERLELSQLSTARASPPLLRMTNQPAKRTAIASARGENGSRNVAAR
jgi:hypothetical protein